MEQRGRSNFRGNKRGHGRGRGGHYQKNHHQHRNDRGHHRGGRGGRGNFNRNGNTERKSNFRENNSYLYKPESLSEIDVGITEYISTLDGFQAVIKARFSDFHVSEIDLDGNVAKLTDTHMPNEFKVTKVDVPEESPMPIISKDQWKEITEMCNSTDDSLSVKIDVTTADKEQRSLVHKTLKSIFHTKIISNTIEEGDSKFILLKRMTGKNKHDRPDQWPAHLPIYTHFILFKESLDTMNAIMNISDAIRVNSSIFNYAGVKDKRAKTSQWISCKKVDPGKLLYRTKNVRNVKIGNIQFKDTPLSLGQLDGNLFKIALRDVTVDDEVVNTHLEHLKEHGYINYYGLQRFGNDKSVPTHAVGVKLLQGNFKEAINLILKPKKYENPESSVAQAKKIYAETENAYEAVQKLAVNHTVESKLLFGLSKFGKNDYVNALECIPRNMRLMYIHSFQSLVWNQVVSKRIKDLGLIPAVGDLVYIENQPENELVIDETPIIKEEEEDTKNESKELKDTQEDEKVNIKQLVKVLTEEDLPNYTIYDIVLPLPGYNVTYPENLKDYYVELLSKYKLSIDMPQQRVKCYTLSGNYRKVIGKPAELKWHMMKYTNPHENLIRSDFEELCKRSEPESDPLGISKGLVVRFKLKSSSYATMVLREILKIDTSAQHQSSLNAPTENQEEEKLVPKETKPEEIVEIQDSMLKDKGKVDALMKLIEEGDENEEEEIRARLKRHAEETEEKLAALKKAKLEKDEEEEGIKAQASLV